MPDDASWERGNMRVLMLGDVIGRPGRRAIANLVPQLRREYSLDLVLANAENAAGGLGLTPDTARELLDAGVDVLTSGNHIWDHMEIIPHLDSDMPIIRPLNYPQGAPGRGYILIKGALVVNLVGRVFMGSYECPFRTMDRLLQENKRSPVVLVDFHAEATSEKGALGHYLDGRVSAVLGSHTHVGTADAQILPGGTAFITDVGMVGPKNSVIGDDVEAVVHRFLTQLPHRLSVGKGSVILSGAMVDVDTETGQATSIVRVDREIP